MLSRLSQPHHLLPPYDSWWNFVSFVNAFNPLLMVTSGMGCIGDMDKEMVEGETRLYTITCSAPSLLTVFPYYMQTLGGAVSPKVSGKPRIPAFTQWFQSDCAVWKS
jgi:hypothetical protein